LLFPNGRFIPRWSAALLVAVIGFTIIFSEWPESQASLVIGWPFVFGGVAVCIGYRYWRVSLPSERQQTKWVVFGFVTFFGACVAYYLPIFSPLGATVYAPLAYLAYEILLPIVPITFFIAMQRYHLYEIDRIINKALVYGSLSAILAVVYVSGVLGLQAIARTITGQESPIALVASTLLIAALFQPARSRLQQLIDRRFYRRKYDAQKTLATFNATLRQEVSLTELQGQLVTAVKQTLQPVHISLWIAPRKAVDVLSPETLASGYGPGHKPEYEKGAPR
jgi:hypothetical protein